jgi:hypothetical protein
LEALVSVVSFASWQFAGLTVDGANNIFDPPKPAKGDKGSGSKRGSGSGSSAANNDAGATSTGGKKKKKGSKAGSKAASVHSASESSITDLSKFTEKVLAQTLAAWLNFAKGSIRWDDVVTVDGVDMTFGELIQKVEDLLMLPNPTKADLEEAKDLAEAVNVLDKDNTLCDTGSGSSRSGSSSSRGSSSGSESTSGSRGGRGRR